MISLTFLFSNSSVKFFIKTLLLCTLHCISPLMIPFSYFLISTREMSETIIKIGSMIKRSQNKKRWSIVNYKTRFFELSHTHLIYFDNCEGEVREHYYFLLFYCKYFYVYKFLFSSHFFRFSLIMCTVLLSLLL